MKNIFLLLSILLFASCGNKEKQLVGHWHEFEKGNDNFICCHKITDSTYTITMNVFDFMADSILKRGIDIQKNEVFTPQKRDAIGYHINDYFTTDFSIKENKIAIADSIYWVKQKDDRATFTSHFSMGLLINIHPFETDQTDFNFDLKQKTNVIFIAIGKLKKSTLQQSNKYNLDDYYLQLNDKISFIKDLKEFIFYDSLERNEGSQIAILINADRNVPQSFLSKLEAKILNCGYQKNQMYYLTINSNKRVYGYNHRNL